MITNHIIMPIGIIKKSTGAGTTIRLIPPHPSADKLQPQTTILTRDSGTALGIEPETASTAVRISMGRFTTKEECIKHPKSCGPQSRP